MLALALLLASLTPEDSLADKIVRCGVDRAQIRVGEEMGTEIAVITAPSATLTSDHLACLVGLAIGGDWLAFEDPAAQARFAPLVQAASRKAAEIEAIDWLRQRDLLKDLPVYDPARQSLAEFAVSLEALCGLAPGTALKVADEGRLNIVPPETLTPDEANLTAFQCVVSATLAANTEPYRYSIGFVGGDPH